MAIQAQSYSEDLGFAIGIGSSQDIVMDNACGSNQVCFNLQQRLEKQLQQQLQHQNSQNTYFENNGLIAEKNNPNCHVSMPLFSQYIGALIEKQKLEIDRFISLQNDRLRWALEEQGKQQLAFILRKYETRTQFLLRQKDEEIAKAARRRVELEDFLKIMESEKQSWQKLAKENEIKVLSLNSTIEQLKENACLSSNGVEDAESCCDVAIEDMRGNMAEERVNAAAAQQITRKMVCKGCNSRGSCIIVLPCRHLCLCQACESFLASCPLCGVEKKATIEVLI